MSISETTGQADARAPAEARRHQRIAIANRAGWPELERRHLRFGAFSTVVDERDETTYTVHRGEVDEAIGPAHPVVAYFYDETGFVHFLERLPVGRR